MHHHLDEGGEADARRPAEHAAGLRRVADQVVDLGGTEERGVFADVAPPVEPRGGEGDLHHLLDAVRFAARDDEIVAARLLQHAPHRVDVVAREAEIPPRGQVAERQVRGETELDARDAVRDLPGDELASAPWARVVEEDPGRREEPVALPVVDGDVVRVDLGDAVGATRVEGRRLALRRLADPAEHLARARLIDARLRRDEAHGLQQSGHTDGVELGGEHRLRPRRRHERLRRQVVELVRPHGAQQIDQRELVEEVGLAEIEAAPEMRDALEVLGARPAHHADDAIALLEQELGQVRAVLAGDAGDERGRHGPQLRP